MNDRNRGGRGSDPRDDRDGWQRQSGSSARPSYPRDHDRDRNAYDQDGRSRHPWQGASPAYDPYVDHARGMGTRDYAYGQDGAQHDARDAEQIHRHGRAVGERGYGPEYQGRDGYGGAERAPVGKGPKNYVRSDERMREEICERLSAQPYDWSDVEVHVSDGEATLTGTVRTREIKYVGERIAEGVRGIRDVMNQIRLERDARPTESAPESEPRHTNGSDKRSRNTMVSR